MRRHPFQFHFRYFWRDKIDLSIIGENCGPLPAHPEGERQAARLSMSQKTNGKLLPLARAVLPQPNRNASLDLRSLLQYQDCRGELSGIDPQGLQCTPSDRLFPANNGFPILFTKMIGAAK